MLKSYAVPGSVKELYINLHYFSFYLQLRWITFSAFKVCLKLLLEDYYCMMDGQHHDNITIPMMYLCSANDTMCKLSGHCQEVDSPK